MNDSVQQTMAIWQPLIADSLSKLLGIQVDPKNGESLKRQLDPNDVVLLITPDHFDRQYSDQRPTPENPTDLRVEVRGLSESELMVLHDLMDDACGCCSGWRRTQDECLGVRNGIHWELSPYSREEQEWHRCDDGNCFLFSLHTWVAEPAAKA